MATTLDIRDDLLYPGDTIRFDYVIRGGNQTLLDMAIGEVKRKIYSDDRLDYQGSEIVGEVDKSGLSGSVEEIRVLRVYAKVRRYRREASPQVQEAGIGAIALVSIVALLAGAWAYSQYISFRGATIVLRTAQVQQDTTKMILESDLSSQQKTEVLTSQADAVQSAGVKRPIFGSSIPVLGGGLATAAVIIGVLLVVFGGARRPGGVD